MDDPRVDRSLRDDMRAEMVTWREDDDDHFYGPWFGGPRSAGGYGVSTRFKSASAAESYLRTKHGVKADLRGLDPTLANEVTDAFDLADDYLGPAGHGITSISMAPITGRGDDVLTEFHDMRITLNRDVWTKPDVLRDHAAYDAETLWTVSGRPRDHVLHAIGHGVNVTHPHQADRIARDTVPVWTSYFPLAYPTGRGPQGARTEEQFAESFALAAMAKAQGKVDRARVGPTGSSIGRVYASGRMGPQKGRSVIWSRWDAVDRFEQHWQATEPLGIRGNPRPNAGLRTPKPVREADDDDHYYGPWRGGKKSEGGGPAGPPGGYGRLVSQAKEGGFTVAAFGGDEPESGFMVSPYSANEQVVPVSRFTKTVVKDYIAKNEELLKKPDHFLGGWRDGDNVYLDVSVNSPTLEATRTLAREHNQLAAWDIKGGQEVRFAEAAVERRSLLNVRTATEKDIDAFVAYLLGDDKAAR